jgi:hypothetical protein
MNGCGKKQRRVDPFEHAEVVIKWKGIVIAQVHDPKFDSCANGNAHSIKRINVNPDRLGPTVCTSRGSKRVIDLGVFQPNLSADQVRNYKRACRQLGAL